MATIKPKFISVVPGVDTSHLMLQALHTSKHGVVFTFLQLVLPICPPPCPSSWAAVLYMVNSQGQPV